MLTRTLVVGLPEKLGTRFFFLNLECLLDVMIPVNLYQILTFPVGDLSCGNFDETVYQIKPLNQMLAMSVWWLLRYGVSNSQPPYLAEIFVHLNSFLSLS